MMCDKNDNNNNNDNDNNSERPQRRRLIRMVREDDEDAATKPRMVRANFLHQALEEGQHADKRSRNESSDDEKNKKQNSEEQGDATPVGAVTPPPSLPTAQQQQIGEQHQTPSAGTGSSDRTEIATKCTVSVMKAKDTTQVRSDTVMADSESPTQPATPTQHTQSSGHELELSVPAARVQIHEGMLTRGMLKRQQEGMMRREQTPPPAETVDGFSGGEESDHTSQERTSEVESGENSNIKENSSSKENSINNNNTTPSVRGPDCTAESAAITGESTVLGIPTVQVEQEMMMITRSMTRRARITQQEVLTEEEAESKRIRRTRPVSRNREKSVCSADAIPATVTPTTEDVSPDSLAAAAPPAATVRNLMISSSFFASFSSPSSSFSSSAVQAAVQPVANEGNDMMSVFGRKLGFRPTEMTGSLRGEPTFIFYLDGSGETTTNAAAAAIVVRYGYTTRCHTLATSCTQSTNEVGEWTAMGGALNLALQALAKLPKTTTILILTDSSNVYKAVTKHGNAGSHSLKGLRATAKDYFTTVNKKHPGQLIIGKMAGHIGASQATYNLADHAARKARNESIDFSISTFCSEDGRQLRLPPQIDTNQTYIRIGEADLEIPDNLFFPTWSFKVTKQYALGLHQLLRSNVASGTTEEEENMVKTFEDYVAVRRMKTRQSVPEPCRALWVNLVKGALLAIVNAEDEETLNIRMRQFLILPNRYLPANQPEKRVVEHFRRGTPFHMELDGTKKQHHRDREILIPSGEAGARRKMKITKTGPRTLETVAKQLNCSVEALRELNPELRDLGKEETLLTKEQVEMTRKRLERAMERKAKQKDIKGALQLAATQAEQDGTDMKFEDKCKKVRDKMPDLKMMRWRDTSDKTTKHIAKITSPGLDDAHLKQIADSMEQRTSPTPNIDMLRKTMFNIKWNAAQAIDGWGRGLLDFVIDSDAEIAELLLTIIGYIIEGKFDGLTMDCVLATRVVAIPKIDGGVRPISVSNFFLKLAGGMALRSGRDKLREWQYAETGNVLGAKIIVHKCRQLLKQGYTLAKFDIKNAYGEMPRALCAEVVEKAKCPALTAYFKTVYLRASRGVIYGSGTFEVISLKEGVRQGDATSAYIFCRALDVIIAEIVEECKRQNIPIEEKLIFCYMDDLTIALPSGKHSHTLAKIVQAAFQKYTMEVNYDSAKSAAISWKEDITTYSGRYTMLSKDGEFELLGASLSCDTRSFFKKKRDRQQAFFDLLKQLHLHPALLFTILRLCGNPRISYLCAVMPPGEEMEALTEWFDRSMMNMLDCKDLFHGRLATSETARKLVYEPEGLDMTNYNMNYSGIYETTALTATPSGLHSLPTLESASAECRPRSRYHVGYQWMYYTGKETDLNTAEYATAMCIHLGCYDCGVPFPLVCGCGALTGHIENNHQFIEHALSCPKGMFTAGTGVSRQTRHDAVKNNALVAVPISYNIPCTTEPTIYGMYYEKSRDDVVSRQRPDVEYHLVKHLTIDLSVVHRPPTEEVGKRAQEMANIKVKNHQQAVKKAGHEFAPFIIETDGYLHSDAVLVIQVLARSLPPWQHSFFIRDMLRAISVNLMRQKVLAVTKAIMKIQRAWKGDNYANM